MPPVTASIEDLLPRFLAILSTHRGLAQAISVAEMAGQLGFERDKAGQRRAQLVKAAAVAAGHLVGSSCGLNHGWYQPESDAEIQATLGQYKARIRSLAALIRQTEGAAGVKTYLGQLAMEFEPEVSV
jgi:hypothetical protein